MDCAFSAEGWKMKIYEECKKRFNYHDHEGALMLKEKRKRVSEERDTTLLAEWDTWEIVRSDREDESVFIYYLVHYYPVTNVIERITAMTRSEILGLNKMLEETVEREGLLHDSRIKA